MRGSRLTLGNIIAFVALTLAIVAFAFFMLGMAGEKTSALGVASAAFLFSIFTFIREYDLRKRIVVLEEEKKRDRELKRKKAVLRASIEKDLNSSGRRRTLLKIRNDGQCEARKVKILLDGVNLMEHSAISQLQKHIELIGPGSSINYIIDFSVTPYKILITWQDDSGEKGKYETPLTC